MIAPKVLIAVKVFAAEALFNLRYRYPWITEELTNQLQFLMINGSAAIQSRGKKLLNALKKSRRLARPAVIPIIDATASTFVIGSGLVFAVQVPADLFMV